MVTKALVLIKRPSKSASSGTAVNIFHSLVVECSSCGMPCNSARGDDSCSSPHQRCIFKADLTLGLGTVAFDYLAK
jgi:hypothetical protein